MANAPTPVRGLGPDALRERQLLIIDRSPTVRTYLRTQLSALGVGGVQGATSAVDALRLVQASAFDVILCEYQLEDGHDGQQLLEELRHKRLIPLSTVFIVITAESACSNVIAVAELAPDDYLIKPFTADQLQSRLLRALQRKQALAAIYRRIEAHQADAALAACDRLLREQPALMFDVLRLKGEILDDHGRHEEAQRIYRAVLDKRPLPWASMGLARTLAALGDAGEGLRIAREVVAQYPRYLAAYDFLARLHEQAGRTEEAHAVLEQATLISPHNIGRLRSAGDLALRGGKLEAAEQAYERVLKRSPGLRKVDDYANLARVRIERGDVDAATATLQTLRRERRGDRVAEVAALSLESAALSKKGDSDKAQALLAKALALHEADPGSELSQKLRLDLAQACLASGRPEAGSTILRQVAAEHHEDAAVLGEVQRVYDSLGDAAAGKAMVESVAAEIVRINDEGVLKARDGDFEGSVALLTDAAERMPNVQFLVNASKAIFTLLDRRGWDTELEQRGVGYLQRAWVKDPASPRVASGKALYLALALKHGVKPQSLAAS